MPHWQRAIFSYMVSGTSLRVPMLSTAIVVMVIVTNQVSHLSSYSSTRTQLWLCTQLLKMIDDLSHDPGRWVTLEADLNNLPNFSLRSVLLNLVNVPWVSGVALLEELLAKYITRRLPLNFVKTWTSWLECPLSSSLWPSTLKVFVTEPCLANRSWRILQYNLPISAQESES
jgi:hypothetical protein